MIRKGLEFTKSELQSYFNLKDTDNMNSVSVVLSNILDQEGKVAYESSGSGGSISHFLVLTLVNVEEEKHLKPPHRVQELGNQTIAKKNPGVNLNLYVLFSAFSSQYETALGMISDVIAFFQGNSYFGHDRFPTLDANIEKIIADLHSLTFEQQNYLWGLMGAKYMPSVVYKLRMFSIDDDRVTDKAKYVTSIEIKD